MDRKERESILREGGVRPASSIERAAAQRLERDLEGSPLAGRPLTRRLGRPTAEGYVASLGGPLPYMVRLREIEEETEAHEQALEQAWRTLVGECAGDAEFAERWRRTAERWSFAAVNDLIERHNRWYPAEARLPMDPRRGDFVQINGRPYERRPLDAAWVLERFPAARPAAAA